MIFALTFEINPIIPKPEEMTFGTESIMIDRCSIKFTGDSDSQILASIHKEIFAPDFPCSTNEIFPIHIETEISSDSCSDESYELFLSKDSGKLSAKCYVGIIRAYSTLMLIFSFDEESRNIPLDSLPIHIKDKPRFDHRGLMIDTSRHYLKKETIRRIINAMMYGKLNVLHWHLVDDDSFPMESKAYPDLTKAAAFSPSMIYKKSDIQELIQYAKTRGVRVVPEIDTPSHSRAIGLYEPLKKLVTCFNSVMPYNIKGVYKIRGGPPNAALDPTMDETYNFIKGIIGDINNYFTDELVHLGGDEVRSVCWDERPSIKEFMKKHNIPDYNALRAYYMEKEYAILKSLNSLKKPIYWVSEAEFKIKYNKESILQYWGKSNDLGTFAKNFPNNKVILSPHDYAYLDCGYENPYGMNAWCGNFKTWAKMYYFEPTHFGIASKNILGGEVCAWAEVMNDDNIENKIWPRSVAYAAAFWEKPRPQVPNLPDLVASLNHFSKNLKSLGVSTSPITGEYCELRPKECFQKY